MDKAKTTGNLLSIRRISSKQAETIIRNEANDGNLCFITGAGISKIPPANLPLGNELKDRLIDLITEGKKARKYRNKILLHPKYQDAIPELIFQPIYECIGSKIYQVFDILKYGHFNHIHKKLGWYSKIKKAGIYTTNFDMLIEHASTFPVDVQHLHGSIDKPEEMIIRIYQVGRGISKNLTNRFKKKNNGKVLVVLGYSGNDPDIMTLINNTSFKSIIWLVRDFNNKRGLSNLKKLTHHTPLLFQNDLNKLFRDKRMRPSHSKPSSDTPTTILTQLTEIEALKCLQAVYFVIEDFKVALHICNHVFDNKSFNLSPKDHSWFHQVAADNLNRIGIDFRAAISHMKAAIKINIKNGN